MTTTTSIPSLLENGLPSISRYITTHDSHGKAMLAKEVPSKSTWQKIGSVAKFFLGYTTRTFPVALSEQKDVGSYEKDLASPPGLTGT